MGNSSLDSIYFKNYLTSTKKMKRDIKEPILFIGTQLIAVGGLLCVVFPRGNNDIKTISESNNLQDSSVFATESTPVSTTATENSKSVESTSRNTDKTETVQEDSIFIPESAAYFNMNYYQLYSGVVDSWEEAERYCENLGGHLAVINTEEENAYLYNYMVNCDFTSAYFGLLDVNNDNNWKWIDGSELSYTNWADGEPSSLSEPYGMFYFKFTDGKWNDGQWGDNTTAFICEWDTNESGDTNVDVASASQTPVISPDKIETLGDVFYYNNHSYQLFRLQDITGTEVISYCANLGGYFAHINDEAENQFLASYFDSQGYDIVYFGYSDEKEEGVWEWIDGEYSSYENWRSGEPNNEAGLEHYALISNNGTWNDGKLERDSQNGGAIILCEWNYPLSNDNRAKKLSDFRSCLTDINASSHLASETYSDGKYEYTPQKAVDNDMSTCWSEGTDSYGIGESITLYFNDTYEISELCLWNGLCTSEDLFYKNSRLHNIKVVLSNGDSYDFECSDGWDNRKSTFSFNSGTETSSLTIVIQSVYEGNKYKDTCISEISVS